MPSVSPKQHRFMEAIAHSPSFAAEAGVPQSVGKDFAAADKREGHMANKGYSGSVAKYAQGGAVLGKTSQFLKSEDQFRAAYHKDPGAGADKPYGKSGINSGTGEVKPPEAKGKSLAPVKPRK